MTVVLSRGVCLTRIHVRGAEVVQAHDPGDGWGEPSTTAYDSYEDAYAAAREWLDQYIADGWKPA